jgi:hypothetical protein
MYSQCLLFACVTPDRRSSPTLTDRACRYGSQRIDRTGTIRWQHVDEDYKTRPTPAQMPDIAARTLEK